MISPIIYSVFFSLLACGDSQEEAEKAKKTVASCPVSLNSLGGSEWVILRADAKKGDVPDVKTRIKFYREDKILKAKYNVSSISDMYEYQCTIGSDKATCIKPPKAKDSCLALLAAGKTCDRRVLMDFYDDFSSEDIEDGVDEANDVVLEHKKKKRWDGPQSVKGRYNTLLNKLMGKLVVRVDKKACNLVITDKYVTLFNGSVVEDTNPVGMNAFTKNQQGELLWEHCSNVSDLIDTTSAKPLAPNSRPTTRYPAGTDVHFWVQNAILQNSKPDCSYSYDLWFNGQPYKKGLKPESVADKKKEKLQWHFQHKFEKSSEGVPQVFTMVTERSCKGKAAVKKVLCTGVIIE